ncbi:MBL fold metallo-hydrolase [candidate division KSB3 bacterium]|uniref:MBL fold metallo-hydrolase n=1 Tax=candidate division KSB3 bacterium TaxID=2044937 RepID=A0A2G6E830_9BACT|nr:MAG: MBL fold metallo-hydrolase [candidate division KSB3 bacterium]PIE30439.1 MAG: MBL fold metallo-hydrolase [candidate division KSB3 bacterium]
MLLEILVVGPLRENCYIVVCEESREAVVIDPGDEAARIYQVLKKHNWQLKYIINTHGHIDHIGGVAGLLEEVDVPFLLHQDDMYLLEGLPTDPLQAMLQITPPPHPGGFLKDGDRLDVGRLEFQVLHTPGHTPGCVCFLVEDKLFSGDTLFAHSIGRTDLPGGDHAQLLASVREKLFSLDDLVTVYPGHGPETSIGHERQFNPFF